MAKTTAQHIRLGIFIIFGTILLVFSTYLIGNNENLFSKTFALETVFSNVNGLQKGNNVRFSGINVGTVKAIEMENDTVVRVYMAIEEKMLEHIKKDAIATIGSDGLVGNMIINIIPGKNSKAHVIDGDEIESYSRIGTEDMLSTLNVTNQNAALLTADLLKVTQALTKGRGTLGRLLNDTIMANDLKTTITNLKLTSAKANTSIDELNSIIKSINFNESVAGVLLSDSVSGDKMKVVINNLESSSSDIEKMTKNLSEVISDIKNGEGAIHYLSTDTTFVNDLETTMRNVEEGTARFNENMEALKHNFLTRGYFRKLERQEKKARKKEMP